MTRLDEHCPDGQKLVTEIDAVFDRCLTVLTRHWIPAPSGWPQYLPRRAGDLPGLCGTSYAILTISALDTLRNTQHLDRFDKAGLLATLVDKMDELGGFMIDTLRPIPSIDACWESIMDLLALGLPSAVPALRLALRYVVAQMNIDGGWGISEVVPDSRVFPTTQMVSLFATNDWHVLDPPMREAVAICRDRGVAWLIAAQHADGGWGESRTSSAAMTARALVALLDAGHRVDEEILVRGRECLLALVRREDLRGEPLEVLLYGGRFPVQRDEARLFRYTHFTRAWALLAMLRCGIHPLDPAVLSLTASILGDEEGGVWRDEFERFDTTDGRVAWAMPETPTSMQGVDAGEDGRRGAAERIAVWPIFNNTIALVELVRRHCRLGRP